MLAVSLRFDVPGTATDEWKPSATPLPLDLGQLAELRTDEPAYATALTDTVMSHEDVRGFYRRARAWTEGNAATLHLRLHIDAPAALHSVRWECLRDPDTGTPIATRDDVLFSRYLSSTDWGLVATRPAGVKHAVVAVAGPTDIGRYRSSPDGQPLADVEVNEEIARASEALVGYRLTVLGRDQPVTLANLLATLEEEVDVLYLVCHGLLKHDVPLLLLEHEDRSAAPVDGRALVERLSELEKRPALAVLGSCQSASASGEVSTQDEGVLAALGPRLAAVGVAAVVAMQGNITMRSASIFSAEFFGAFAQRNGVVDHAMAVARRALRSAERDDWWAPVLFSRLRSGRTYYRPAFTESADDTWENLRLMIQEQGLTPVLGPGLADGILGSRQDIARRWVRRWQLPIAAHVQSDLAQVAQYLRVRMAPDTVRAALLDHLRTEIHERRESAQAGDAFDLPDAILQAQSPLAALEEIGRRQRKADPGEPYRVLAAIPAPIYVTTGWTDLLQDALRECDPPRKPVTMTFPWNSQSGKRQAELTEEPSVERPLVYHLFGRFQDRRSLVLTEDDYFAWLKAWIARRDDIPSDIGEALNLQSLLFLGFRLDDWDFRVVFQSIKSFEGSELNLQRNRHAGVQLSPENQSIEPEAAQEYLESTFGRDQISIYWGNTRDFLDELRHKARLDT
ncbi:CHAT domain-containing protein [Nocardioides immobilis]|uniref:CHAT domain-containing protein n=1 Tax=Nocardioides immobilis TaxID=2049295 RepID=A0A417XT03_9ACTN|nr:CHAT domain-containing protein [Nocardioides immobilis]